MGWRFGVLDIIPLWNMCFLIESLSDLAVREVSVFLTRFMACNCRGVPNSMVKSWETSYIVDYILFGRK